MTGIIPGVRVLDLLERKQKQTLDLANLHSSFDATGTGGGNGKFKFKVDFFFSL